MCGIVGYFTKNRGTDDDIIFHKLIKESRIRGIHSFGYSYIRDGRITMQKFHDVDFKSIRMPLGEAIIYHNRYSTSGDFVDHRNNQPIHIQDTSLVFNGVIDMGNKAEMQERWGIQMETENDGEVVLRKSNFNPAAMVEFVKEHGSFSGLVLQGNSLYAFTNGLRPLWYWELGQSVFLASTKDIFTRALPNAEPKQLKVNTLHEWKN